MFVKRALGVGLLALTGVAVAQQGLRLPQAKPAPPGGDLPQLVGRMYSAAEITELKTAAAEVALHVKEARVPTRKTPTAELQVLDDATGRILFKVVDDRQVLVQGDGSVLSLANRDVDPIQQVFREGSRPAGKGTDPRDEVVIKYDRGNGGRETQGGCD